MYVNNITGGDFLKIWDECIKYYTKYKKEFFIGIGCFLSIIVLLLLGVVNNSAKVSAKTENDTVEEGLVVEKEEVAILIAVDVKGYVNNPGLYYLEEGSVINDVIKLAGGLKEDAATDFINLSKKITDEMVVYVFSISEINDIKNEDLYLELKEEQLQLYLKNTYDELIREALETFINSNIDFEDKNNEDLEENVIININTADIVSLIKIPYIGEEKAKDIIAYRTENGDFQAIEELMNVSGIGQATFDKLKDYVKI